MALYQLQRLTCLQYYSVGWTWKDWEDEVPAYLKVLSPIRLHGLRKSTKTLSQDWRPQGRNSNSGRLEQAYQPSEAFDSRMQWESEAGVFSHGEQIMSSPKLWPLLVPEKPVIMMQSYRTALSAGQRSGLVVVFLSPFRCSLCGHSMLCLNKVTDASLPVGYIIATLYSLTCWYCHCSDHVLFLCTVPQGAVCTTQTVPFIATSSNCGPRVGNSFSGLCGS
jgi:hypothetical protein